MENNKLQFIEDSLNEARYFSKEVRKYLCEIEKTRLLTNEEKDIYQKTHNVHIHTNDSSLLIQEYKKSKQE